MTKGIEITKENFERYLIDAVQLKEYTDSGNKSTVYDYSGRVGKIAKNEGLVLPDGKPDYASLAPLAKRLIPKYDYGGSEEEYGTSSDRAPINALKKFAEFYAYVNPDSTQNQDTYWENVFVIRDEESPNPELDRYTVIAIIEKLAESNSSITYGELAKRVGELRGTPIANQGFAYTLGRVQDYCLELGLPSLPVMVVNQNHKPASGFAEHYRENHPEVADLTEDEIARNERKACLACLDWQSLYDRVGLAEEAPIMRNLFAERESKPIYEEGERITRVMQKEIKRNPAARAQCLAIKGYRCVVCEQDLNEVYGVPGIIHVHHLKPIAESVGAREVDPEKDLVPVCPNCHAVIHSKSKDDSFCYTINEVRKMLGLKTLEEYC